MAQQVADEINGASVDLKAERKELADIIFQLNNGTKAILKGIDKKKCSGYVCGNRN